MHERSVATEDTEIASSNTHKLAVLHPSATTPIIIIFLIQSGWHNVLHVVSPLLLIRLIALVLVMTPLIVATVWRYE